MVDVSALLGEFAERPENSARSVLVTILGDSVVPLGGEVWLADVIGLMEPFGVNERLVRTSVFRLTSEGWLDSDRIGRRSRYRLTEFARREFAVAEERIYHAPADEWSGEWTLVFEELAALAADDRRRLDDHLRWAGFARLASGVRAFPGDGSGIVRDLEGRLGLARPLPLATAHFHDLHDVTGDGSVADRFDVAAAADRYGELIERYGDLHGAGSLDGRDSFVFRTMVVHDLRRAALVDPRLPRELLPEDWVGDAARSVAGARYRDVDAAAWRWLEQVTGLRSDAPRRFVAC